MKCAVGERIERVCETMGRMGGRCVNFLCTFGIP